MKNREIKNAKITGVSLGYEDHGVFTCNLTLDYGGGGQSFGGYTLDEPKRKNGKFLGRFGTAYGMEFLIRILKVVGVETWEDLKGKSVRVDASWDKVHRIGNYLRDEWFDPEADLKDFIGDRA